MVILSGEYILSTRVGILVPLRSPEAPAQKVGFLGGIVGRWNLGEILDLWKCILRGDHRTTALVYP